MSEYKTGDKIVVTDAGETYSSYSNWPFLTDFEDYFIKDGVPLDGEVYTYLRKGRHGDYNEILYLIQDKEGQVFIIGDKGVEPYKEEILETTPSSLRVLEISDLCQQVRFYPQEYTEGEWDYLYIKDKKVSLDSLEGAKDLLKALKGKDKVRRTVIHDVVL